MLYGVGEPDGTGKHVIIDSGCQVKLITDLQCASWVANWRASHRRVDKVFYLSISRSTSTLFRMFAMHFSNRRNTFRCPKGQDKETS